MALYTANIRQESQDATKEIGGYFWLILDMPGYIVPPNILQTPGSELHILEWCDLGRCGILAQSSQVCLDLRIPWRIPWKSAWFEGPSKVSLVNCEVMIWLDIWGAQVSLGISKIPKVERFGVGANL